MPEIGLLICGVVGYYAGRQLVSRSYSSLGKPSPGPFDQTALLGGAGGALVGHFIEDANYGGVAAIVGIPVLVSFGFVGVILMSL